MTTTRVKTKELRIEKREPDYIILTFIGYNGDIYQMETDMLTAILQESKVFTGLDYA